MRAAVLALICLPCFGAGFDGWGKVKWGATPSEIRDAYKEDGITEDLSLPKYAVDGDDYVARFGMTPEGLSSIELQPLQGDYLPPKSGSGPDDILKLIKLNKTAVRLSLLLEEKYGPPSKNLSKISNISDIFMEWYFDGGNIRLRFMLDPADKRGMVYKLRLRYERKNKALDKL